MVVIDRKWWSPSIGFTGRHAPERALRHRARKRAGTELVMFELSRGTVDVFVELGLLSEDRRTDHAAIKSAIMGLCREGYDVVAARQKRIAFGAASSKDAAYNELCELCDAIDTTPNEQRPALYQRIMALARERVQRRWADRSETENWLMNIAERCGVNYKPPLSHLSKLPVLSPSKRPSLAGTTGTASR